MLTQSNRVNSLSATSHLLQWIQEDTARFKTPLELLCSDTMSELLKARRTPRCLIIGCQVRCTPSCLGGPG